MDSEVLALHNGTGNLATVELHTWRLKCEQQATLISRLEEEIEGLRAERKDYLEGLKEKRKELASFQGKLDDAASEIADLRRALIRAQDTQSHHHIPQRPGPQMPLTPPPAPVPQNSDPVVVVNNEEVQHLGSSSIEDIPKLDSTPNTNMNNMPPPVRAGEGSKWQSTPRMVPFVSLPPRASSIKHERPRADPGEMQSEPLTDDSARSPKRRKVEAAATPSQPNATPHGLQTPLSSPAATTIAVTSRPATSTTTQHPNPKVTRSTEKSTDLARSSKRRKFEAAISRSPKEPRVMTRAPQSPLPDRATTIVVSSSPTIPPNAQRPDPGETEVTETQPEDLARSSRHRTVETTTATPRRLRATTHGLQTALPSPATSTIAAPSQPAASPTTQRTDPGETQTTETQTDDRARSPEHPTVDTTDTPRRLRTTTHGLQTALPVPATSTIVVSSHPATSPITQRTDPGETQATDIQTDDRTQSSGHRTVETTATPRRLRATTHGLQTPLSNPATSTIAVSSHPATSPITQRTDSGETQATDIQTDDRTRSSGHRAVEVTATPRRFRATTQGLQTPLSNPASGTVAVSSRPVVELITQSTDPKVTRATERSTDLSRSSRRREFEATAPPRQLRGTNRGPQLPGPSAASGRIAASSRPAIPPTTQTSDPEGTQARESSADLARPPKHRKPEVMTIPRQSKVTINDSSTSVSSPVASTSLVPSSPTVTVSHDAGSISPIASPSRLSRPRLILRPPKPKLKDEAFVIPPSTISEHLKSCNPLHISPPPGEIYVPRRFIRSIYGGNDQRLVQKIGSHRNPSGPTERRAMFPMYDMNPSTPCKPGEPGLMYGSRLDLLTKGSPYTLFASDLGSKKAVWTYVGEYECTRCGTMDAQLFKDQRQDVKNAWGALIRDGKQWDIYVAMHARIALRKAKLPTPVEKVNEEMANIRANNGRPVSVEDVIAAFEDGTEAIDIIRMQCVAYDHTFANDLEAKFKVWDAPAARAQRQSQKRKRPTVRRNSAIESDGNEGGGLGQSSDHARARRIRSRRDSTTEARTLLAPAGDQLGNDGAFDSDLTEYNYASSVST